MVMRVTPGGGAEKTHLQKFRGSLRMLHPGSSNLFDMCVCVLWEGDHQSCVFI